MAELAERRSRRTLFVATVCVLLAIAIICFWPHHVDDGLRRPLALALREAHSGWLPSWVDYAVLEFGANILLYLPLGFLATMLLPRRAARLVPVAALLLSISVELSQHLLLAGRSGDPRDVAANTIGGVLGWAIAAGVRRRRPAATTATNSSH